MFSLRREPFFAVFENVDGGINGKGVEGMFRLRPFSGLTFDASVTYSDTTLNEDEPNLNGVEGQRLPFNPKWKFSLEGAYAFPLSAWADGRVGGGLRYSSERDGSFDPANNYTAEAYILADLNAGVSTSRHAIDFYVKNLFDERAYTSIIRGLAAPVQPRTIGVRFSTTF